MAGVERAAWQILGACLLSFALAFTLGCSSGDGENTSSPSGQAAAVSSPTEPPTPAPTPTVDSGRVATCTEEAFAAAFARSERITFACSGTIVFTSTRTVEAGVVRHISGDGQEVTLSGGGTVPLFVVAARGNLQLAHLSVSDGRAERGGAVRVAQDGAFGAESVVFTDNVATNAGGAIHAEGDVRIAEATFQHNAARSGGGAILAARGELQVVRTTFDQNRAMDQPGGSGGAIEVGFGSAAIRESTFSANTATGSGGAIDVLLGTATVANSTFFGNSAVHGGAISNLGTLTVINSTIANNASSTFGGISNAAHGSIGTDDPRTLTLRNTIIADNSRQDCGITFRFTDGGGNLVKDRLGSCNVVLGGDPGLAPLQDNGGPTWTMAIGPDSPAFNTGIRAACDAPFPEGAGGVDQRGSPRTTCSAGAFEPDAR